MNKKWSYVTILCFLLGLFGFASYQLIIHLLQYKKAADAYDDLKSVIKPTDDINNGLWPTLPTDLVTESIENPIEVQLGTMEDSLVDEKPSQWEEQSTAIDYVQPSPQYTIPTLNWDQLSQINAEINSWIYQPNTKIDYPIVQASDNAKYIHTNVYGQTISGGSIFMDYRVEDPYHQFVTIVYGHRQIDRSMFGSFAYYDWNPSHVYNNPYLYVYTPIEAYVAEIVAILNVRYTDQLIYQCQFNSDEQKQTYIDYIQAHNRAPKRVELTVEDHLLVLSTCDSAGGRNGGRLVLVCRLESIT